MRVTCPSCQSKERPEGHPLCNSCMKLVDRDLQQRWFNRKQAARKAQRTAHPNLSMLLSKLEETSREVCTQAHHRLALNANDGG